MDILRLLAVFAVIVITTRLKKPLWMALAGASIVTGLVFGLPLETFFGSVWGAATSATTLTLLVVVYSLTFLQQLMEERKMLRRAETSMTKLLNNRRMSLAVTPVLIGLLPAPGAVLMAASVIEGSCSDYMSREDMAFVSTFFRHVPESSLPTYTSVILAAAVSGLPMAPFLLCMIPFILLLMAVPYVIYLRRVPKETGMPPSQNRGRDLAEVLLALWPIILIIVLILGFQLETLPATLIALLALIFIGRYPMRATVAPMVKKAFHPTMLASTFFAMIFREVLGATGAVGRLPALFENLPIPLFLVFAIIFFVGTVVGGLQTMVTMIVPAALAAFPTAQLPMLVLLMSTGHLASQLSPTHICITLAAEYFHVSLPPL